MSTRAIRIVAAVSFIGLASSVAHAQAWLPPRGWTSITFTTGTSSVGDHLFSTPIIDGVDYGQRNFDFGDIDSRSAAVGFVYGVSDRLAVGADLTYLSARYVGDFPETPDVDDGRWHGDLADFRTSVRYQAHRGRVVLTPFAGAVVPSNDYAHHGHAAIGRGLWEIPIGASLGVPFGDRRTWSYLSVTYAYSIVEKLEDIRPNRSNASVEAGFFPTRGLTLRIQGGWQKTHEGLDWASLNEHTFEVHDAGAKADYWSGGAGISYSVNDSVDLFLNWFGVLNGSNTHELSAWTAGLAWNIGPGMLGRRKIGKEYGPEKAVTEQREFVKLAGLSARSLGPR